MLKNFIRQLISAERTVRSGKAASGGVAAAKSGAEAALQSALQFHRNGDHKHALEICEALSADDPQRGDLQHFAGRLRLELGEPSRAAECFERACALEPGNALYRAGHASALKQADMTVRALEIARTVLDIESPDASALLETGNLFKECGDLDTAETCLRKVVALRPDWAGAQSNLALVCKLQGRPEEALDLQRKACAREPDSPEMASNFLLTLNCVEQVPAHEVFSHHVAWARRHESRLAGTRSAHANSRAPGRRLILGILSPDLRSHSVAYFAESLVENLDREHFALACYYTGPGEDAVSARFKAHADCWRALNADSVQTIADVIRDDGVDVLVDLAGHTSARQMLVMARKPAPVQVAWLGYPNTTGLAAVDIRITDAIADPPGMTDALHSERLVRLEGHFLCYRPPSSSPPPGREEGGATGGIVFGSYNNLSKITEDLVGLWAQILTATADSSLVIKAPGLGSASAQRTLLGRFAQHGIAADRLVMEAWMASPADHLASYRRIDIALDSYPYNGTTTTFEALWMGVPVVTLAGAVHAARVGASILTGVGLPHLIAQSKVDYVRLATELAADRTLLALARAGLRDRLAASTLCDGARFARSFESAVRDAWIRWCASGAA